MKLMDKLFKDQTRNLNDKLRSCKLECEKVQEILSGQEKQNRQLVAERDKLRIRVQKLIKRKGKDPGLRQCKNCNNEFNDKENFNWSCRTHRSEWSGEIWWCCGKKGKEAAGCKFGKHESRNDKEEDDEFLKDNVGEDGTAKFERCLCCKELGHKTECCSRDPNMKTGTDAYQESARISRIKEFRKMHVDSSINTAQLI